MTDRPDDRAASAPDGERTDNGPRAILRVPEVLSAIASSRQGRSLAELSQQLKLPKTSLHRLTRTLQHGGYLTQRAGLYLLGPESFNLANLINQGSTATGFPACARPIIEWLAHETQESAMLGTLSDDQSEIVYIDVIDSEAPLRFTIPLGNRRPLYSAAAGKVALAFLPSEAQHSYLEATQFLQITPHTSRKTDMPQILEDARKTGCVFDRGGSFEGASAIASPVFDRGGVLLATISVAGPTDRVEVSRARFEHLVFEAGERLSRILGFDGPYPAQPSFSNHDREFLK